MRQHRVVFGILSFVFILLVLSASPSAIVAADEGPGAKINKCLDCCTNKKLVCFNLNPDRRLCTAFYEECVKTCESEGSVSSDWRDCWSEPADESD